MWASEYGQDKWLAENVFQGKRNGTYLEAGAIDGLLHSNTWYFERELGWRGVLCEANPAMAALVPVNRPLSHFVPKALWDGAPTVHFEQIDSIVGWSGVVETMQPAQWSKIVDKIGRCERRHIEVPATTLNQVMLEAGLTHLDYLSLDLEGAEFRVLRAFDFDRFRVDIIGVEDNDNGNEDLDRLLIDKGYHFLERVGVDNFWERYDG